MTELWQAYGSWVLYGLVFLAFVWIHARMPGGHGSHCGYREDDAATARRQPGGQSTSSSGVGADSHAGHAPREHVHSHRGGCC